MSTESAIETRLSGPSKLRRSAALNQLLDSKLIDTTITDALLKVENVPSNIHEYRDRERYLEDILRILRQDDTSSQQLEVRHIVLRYLLGSLYVNFEKFWGPTIRTIITIIDESKQQRSLVELLQDHLIETNDLIYSDSESKDLSLIEDRPDYILHRNFIFQILTRFAHHVESSSAKFMDQYFRFTDRELHISPFIEKTSREDITASTPENSKSSTSSDDQHDFKNSQKSKFQKEKTKETFITVSKIIHSFRDPNKIHRMEDLKKLTLDLICCRDSKIQKAAFNCLLAFKIKELDPYVPKIFKLIDDKSVRSELTTFSVDEESGSVLDEHRSELMPVLLRILFGKMIGKIGKKGSGRDKAGLRKTLVMRLVATCRQDEILFFFKLLFDPIFKNTRIDYQRLTIELDESTCLTGYVPLNRLQAMLDSIKSYIESIAHLKEDILPYILKLINVITYYAVRPLMNQEKSMSVNERSIKSLKSLRRECIDTIAEFFRVFEYYEFKQNEIDFVFEYLIWPSTNSFIDKNHATPTPLLRLIEIFASNPSYNILLIKRNKLNRDEYLLQHLVDLYASSKTTRPVLKLVASIFSKILRPEKRELDDSEEHEDTDPVKDLPMLIDADSSAPDYNEGNYKINRSLSFGESILIPFIPVIFEKLQKNCRDYASKKSIENRIENDELLVLSVLSEFLKDSQQSLLGARLLLSTLSKQRKSDIIINTLKTSQALLKQVSEFDDHNIIQSIADILSYQRNLDQRNELCKIVSLISEIVPTLRIPNMILQLLNSVDNELPDVVKWNAGFQMTFEYLDGLGKTEMVESKSLKDPFTLLLYQVGYIMNNIDRYDFSIRENSVIFYEKLAEKLALLDDESAIRYFIDEVILERFFKRGLRETNNTIKHSYINALRPIIVHCHSKNRTLSEFHMFYNENTDLDFWINIRHIQLHNRSKALARLIANEDLHKVSPRTLSSYFMPLASAFLFSKAFKSVSSLAENAIKLIGLICRHLNYKTYESTLSYYLDQLTQANSTYQRTNIKLITEILKNFNFDITFCEEAMQHEVENSKLEKRMRKRRGQVDCSDQHDPDVIEADAPSGRKLNKSTAKMVYISVTQRLIPRLESCLNEMTRVEFEHDKKMADYLPEKDEIKRIPIAFAIVQLLNLLPGRYILFRDKLPSLFLKLSSFLKSKNEPVRKAARATLIRIMNFIGPAYMPDLIRVLKQNLDKGFQIHVLNYTVHSILDKIPLRYGDLDASAHELVNLSFKEIFGDRSEDKEIAKILAKTSEAKKTKSYDTLMILANHVSADKLDLLIDALRYSLKTTNDARKVNKLSQCIQKVFTGLSKNIQFPLERLLIFIQSIIEESIPHLKVHQRIQLAAEDKYKPYERNDRYLIRRDPPKDRIKSKINEKGNFHMMVENSLRLLLHTFEKNKIAIKRKELLKRKLDGFISLLSKCLKSSSPRCVMRSLKCIYFIAQTKIDLPAFRLKCNSIVKKLFILLNLYNGVGMAKGDNFDMINMCFKTITLLLLRCDQVYLSQQQIRSLLIYIEQDLHDLTRQGTAFATLNSLLNRKFESPELPDIMAKISELLVTTDSEVVRSLTIKMYQTYLLDYKHEGGALQNHLMKLMRQLDYEYIDGRKSVIRMLNVVISRFDKDILGKYFDIMFPLLAHRIVSEESQEVRALVGRLISLLLQRLPENQQGSLNTFVMKWTSNDSNEIRLLGVKLLSIFCEANSKLFDKSKIERILRWIQAFLESQNGSKSEDNNVSENNELSSGTRLLTTEDRLIYSSLRLFKRLLDNKIIKCTENRYIETLKKIWFSISSVHLISWYSPTVTTCCELYLYFIQENDLKAALDHKDPTTDQYLEWNAKRIVRTLCDNFILLLDRANESIEILNNVTIAMVSLGQMVCSSEATKYFEQEYLKAFDDGDIQKYLLSLDDLPSDGFIHEHLPYKITESKKHVDLAWLSLKVIMQARKEAAIHRLSDYHRREFVLKWTAAIAQELGPKRISPYIALLMMTPVRELTDKGKDKMNEASRQNVVVMAEDLLKYIKSLMSLETFNRMYSKVQLHYTKRRVDRKKKEAMSKIKNLKRSKTPNAKRQKRRRLK